QVLFINFEDERICHITKEELHEIMAAYQELFDYEPLIVLDEVQNIDGWEHFARRLADEKRRVLITGSNAYMLSRDMAAVLGGRYVAKEVFPFDFEEYLRYRGVTLDKHWAYSPQRAEVVRLFDAYFQFGGIAENFDVVNKREWLTSLYQKVLFSDVVMRNRLRNEQSLSLLVRKLAESVLQPMPIRRLQHVLSSTGQSVTRNTVSAFIGYLHDAYLIFSVSNFTDTLAEREGLRKFYFYDNGLLNLFLFQPDTKLLENIAAIALYKRYHERLFFYRRHIEVDFYVPDEDMAVQVSFSMQQDETRKREVAALKALHAYRPLRRCLIVTRHEEGTLTEGDLTIEICSVWKWLLQEMLVR
ncbi:MAG: ATP-binding protein, partial [Bacteroidales bacterium]|nr:ATP-binding protein [Bacteroidales bacterium]